MQAKSSIEQEIAKVLRYCGLDCPARSRGSPLDEDFAEVSFVRSRGSPLDEDFAEVSFVI